MTAICMADAEFPKHVSRNAKSARFVILELDSLTPALPVQKMPRHGCSHITMGVTADLDSIDAVGKPLQCAGFKYHERLQSRKAEQPMRRAVWLLVPQLFETFIEINKKGFMGK